MLDLEKGHEKHAESSDFLKQWHLSKTSWNKYSTDFILPHS